MFDLEVFLYLFCYFDAICTKAIEMAVECVRWTHGIKIERNNLLCEQAPIEVFRSIFV